MIASYEHFLRIADRVQWDEASIDLSDDALAWPRAGDERVAELIAGFCVGEAGVAEHLAPFAAAASPAAARCFAAQERDEARHARFFARAASDVLGVDDPREQLSGEFLELFEVRLPEAAASAGCDLAAAVGLYHMVLEGVVFTAGQYALLERLDPRLAGLRRGVELVLRDERWHVGFGTRCLVDAGVDEAAILAEGERAAAVWAPEQAERVVTTLRRRLALVRSERVTLH